MRVPGRQGKHLDREDQTKIEELLDTDMTISKIAQRMGCSAQECYQPAERELEDPGL